MDISNNTVSTRKTNLGSHHKSALGAKRVAIYHRANSGDTSIDLTNLVFPSSEYADVGVVNPSYSQILALNIGANKANVKILSSLNGELLRMNYRIQNSSLIEFKNNYVAQENEVFEIWFEPSIISGNMLVDAQPLVQTYLLPEGQSDVPTDPFEYNKFPQKQIGAVMVFRQIDPSGPVVLMMRNENNSPSGDGNYYELSGTANTTSLIRFNNPAGPNGSIVSIVSVGSLVERPTQSMMAYIESINGDVETLRQAVSALTGLDKSTYENAPHSIDLANFGTNVTNILNTEILVATPFEIDERILGSSIVSPALIPTFEKNDLEVGKWYEVTGKVEFRLNWSQIAGDDATILFYCGSTTVGQARAQLTDTGNNIQGISTYAISFKFKAGSSSFSAEALYVNSYGSIAGNGTKGNAGTFIQIQKCIGQDKKKIIDLI